MQYDNLVFGAAGNNNGSGGGTTSDASVTFDLLMEAVNGGRRGTAIDKTGSGAEN